MKAWKENWEFSRDSDAGAQIFVTVRGETELVAEHGWQSSDVPIKTVEARVKLASAAPAMARMLIDLFPAGEAGEDYTIDSLGQRLCDARRKIAKVLQEAGVPLPGTGGQGEPR